MKPSSKHIIKWVDAAHQAQWDDVLTEMASNCRSQKPPQKIEYPKLGLTVVVNQLLDKEDAESKTEAALAKVRLELEQNVLDDPPKVDDSSSDEEVVSAAARAEQEAQAKENLISSALSKHCETVLDETFVQEIRPALMDGWTSLMSGHDFVKHREDTTGNTMFYYDGGLDRDSVAQDKQHPKSVQVTLDHPTAKAFIESAEAHCLTSDRDIMAIADAKNRAISGACRKLIKRTSVHAEDITITFKPEVIRGRQRCSERVLLSSGKPIPVNPESRLYYKQTDCSTDVIVGADANDIAPLVTKAQKESILGISGMSVRDQTCDHKKEMIMLNHEKDAKVIEEIMHHVGAKKVISPTVGMLSLSIAILRRSGTALFLFRNPSHQEVWRAKLLEWLRLEVSTNPTFQPHYLSRADIIRKLRLAPDGPAQTELGGALVHRSGVAGDGGVADAAAEDGDEQDADGMPVDETDAADDGMMPADPTLDLFGEGGADEESNDEGEPPSKKRRRRKGAGKAKAKAKRKAKATAAATPAPDADDD